MTINKLNKNNVFNYWGEFCSTEYEKKFRDFKRYSNIHRLRFVCILTALLYLSGVFGDFWAMGINQRFYTILIFRVMVCLLGMSIALLTSVGKKHLDLAYFVSGYIIALGLAESVDTVLIYKPGVEDGIPFFVFIVLASYLFIPARILPITIGSLTASIIFILALITQTEATSPYIFTTALFFLMANLFGFYFLKTFGCTQRNEYKALEEERILNEQLQIEVAERKKAEEKLLRLATIDDLTNVSNRRYFMEMSLAELKRSQHKGCFSCALMIDIDHFKLINDRYGHDLGDMFLKQTAEIMCSELRESDIIGRLGGEEFGVLLPETNLEEGIKVAQRIRRAVETNPIPTYRGKIQITICVGVAICSFEEANLDVLLKNADVALYEAKNSGRNCVCAKGEKVY